MNTQKHIGANPAFPTAMRLHTTATYTPNLLNQYSQRTVPAYAEISGLATNGSILSFQNLETEEIIRAGRNEKWFHTFMPLEDNSSSAITNTARMFAVLPGAGTNGADLINTNQTLTLAAMKTPEVFTYDDDGNLLSDGRFDYTWNAENRLIAVSNQTGLVASYAYDYQGRRISKTVGSETTTFLWDGNHIVGEFSETKTNVYTWGNNGHLVAASLSGTNVFFCHDGNKNVTELLDANGDVVAHYEFDPFGNMIVKTGVLANANPFHFSNEYYDEETGFVTYKFRPYNPSFGGWLSRDPIEEQGGANVYGFVRNDPVGKADLHGLFAVPSGMTSEELCGCFEFKVTYDKNNYWLWQTDFDDEPITGNLISADVDRVTVDGSWKQSDELTKNCFCLNQALKKDSGGNSAVLGVLYWRSSRNKVNNHAAFMIHPNSVEVSYVFGYGGNNPVISSPEYPRTSEIIANGSGLFIGDSLDVEIQMSIGMSCATCYKKTFTVQ